MYCSKCGKQLNDDANFCYNCGYPLKSSIPEVREATATENNADFMSSQISASNENQQRQETETGETKPTGANTETGKFLKVERKSSQFLSNKRVSVLLDDSEISALDEQSSLKIGISAGLHILEFKIADVSCARLSFEVLETATTVSFFFALKSGPKVKILGSNVKYNNLSNESNAKETEPSDEFDESKRVYTKYGGFPRICSVISAIVLCIGVFLPFARLSFLGIVAEYSFADLTEDAGIILALGILCLVFAILKKYIPALIIDAVNALFYFYDTSSYWSDTSGLVVKGIGFYFLTLGLIAFLIFSIIGIINKKSD